ncbi:myelin protein zero-like protein 2b isoform X1 [Osmerus eperlanus]|uniref:myelin protein zero-like protein 2b isoform X1 n=1 Tax=Osmerus eperlanus TaxID=29151 RepID=UPI002E1597F1
MYRTWFQLLALLGGLWLSGVLRVGGMEVSTPEEMEGVNGTDVTLKCTFKTPHPVSSSTVIVSWNFRPLDKGAEESVFFYQQEPYPPTEGRFKGHAVWSGDIMRKDASITLLDALPTFNGTYTCQVRNLPDVHGINGELVLRVVNKATVSEARILLIAVGGAIGLVLLILSVFVAVRFFRRKHADTDFELQTGNENWKDGMECKPEEELHLKTGSGSEEVELGSH